MQLLKSKDYGMIIGLFFGNFLCQSIIKQSFWAGLLTGLIASLLYAWIFLSFRIFTWVIKKRKGKQYDHLPVIQGQE